MDRLLHHIDLITRQRNRGQLEASLVDALRDLLGAERVDLWKLFAPPGDLMAGLAATADDTSVRMLDDGIAWPEGTGSLDRFPLLQACLAESRMIAVHEQGGLERHVLRVLGPNLTPFGFLVVDARRSLDADAVKLTEGLLVVFRNCIALLDYSEFDTLTGLLNRKTFDEYLITILSNAVNDDSGSDSLHLPRRRQARQRANNHWLGVIDIDHFKSINDTFGHLIGDEVLILVANLMKACFRSQDKLFRFGGEEFVVLLKPTEPEHALATFERYRAEVADHSFPQVGHVTVSTGFTRIGLYDTPSIILDNADEALYYAKAHGRNQVCSYEELIDSGKVQRHQTLHTDVELF